MVTINKTTVLHTVRAMQGFVHLQFKLNSQISNLKKGDKFD